MKALVLVLCCSCGIDPDFITPKGIPVVTNGLDVKAEDVDRAIDLLLPVVVRGVNGYGSGAGDITLEPLQKEIAGGEWTIIFHDDTWQCRDDVEDCGGSLTSGRIDISICWAQALPHELVHWALWVEDSPSYGMGHIPALFYADNSPSQNGKRIIQANMPWCSTWED